MNFLIVCFRSTCHIFSALLATFEDIFTGFFSLPFYGRTIKLFPHFRSAFRKDKTFLFISFCYFFHDHCCIIINFGIEFNRFWIFLKAFYVTNKILEKVHAISKWFIDDKKSFSCSEAVLYFYMAMEKLMGF